MRSVGHILLASAFISFAVIQYFSALRVEPDATKFIQKNLKDNGIEVSGKSLKAVFFGLCYLMVFFSLTIHKTFSKRLLLVIFLVMNLGEVVPFAEDLKASKIQKIEDIPKGILQVAFGVAALLIE